MTPFAVSGTPEGVWKINSPYPYEHDMQEIITHPISTQTTTTQTYSQVAQKQPDRRKCHNCGKLGHIARNCKSSGKTGRYEKKTNLIEKSLEDDSQKELGKRDGDKEVRVETQDRQKEEEEAARRLLALQVDDNERQHASRSGFRFAVERKKLDREKEKVIFSPLMANLSYGFLLLSFLLAILLGFAFYRASYHPEMKTIYTVDSKCLIAGKSSCLVSTTKTTDCHSEKYASCYERSACKWRRGWEFEFHYCKEDCQLEAKEACKDDRKYIDHVCTQALQHSCEIKNDVVNLDLTQKILAPKVYKLIFLILMCWLCVYWIRTYDCFFWHYFVTKKKLSVHTRDIDLTTLDFDLRTDDQKRMDILHKRPLKTEVELTYYETRKKFYYYPDWLPGYEFLQSILSTQISAEHAEVKRKKTYIYYELYVQLIKHANTNRLLTHETVEEKLNMHANYICSINNNRYDVGHYVQDTIMIACLWAKHNRTEPQRAEVFQSALSE